MRKSGILALAGAALMGMAACQKAPQLMGTLPLEDSTKVYLFDLNSQTPSRVDSALVTSNMFVFNGTHAPGIYQVVVPRKVQYLVQLSATETASIVVLGTIDTPPTISCPGGEMLTELERIDADRNEKVALLSDRFDKLKNQEQTDEVKEEMTRLRASYDSLQEATQEASFHIMLNMNKGPMSAFMLRENLPHLTSQQQAKVAEWLGTLDTSMQSNPHAQAIRKHFDTEARLQPGQPFIDFEAQDQQGEIARLSDYAGKGKVVLLEFWASWCGYCRRANPSLVKVYEEYAAKGYEVFGTSLDRDHDEWKKAIEADKLPWPNFVTLATDDKARNQANHPGDLYNVRGIPSNVLLDAEGRIVARNVDADELRERLDTLLIKK